MSVRTSEILEQILALPPSDRAELADSILASLEPTDPALIKLWAAEAEDRVSPTNEVNWKLSMLKKSLVKLIAK